MPHPPRLLLTTLAALALLASACSSRVEERDTAPALLRAQHLYPEEFARRVPRLTQDHLRAALPQALKPRREQAGHPTLHDAYLDLDHPRFVNTDGHTPNADALLQLCTSIPQQDLNPDDFPCPALQDALQRARDTADAFNRAIDRPALDPDELDRLRLAFQGQPPEDLFHPDGSTRDEPLVQALFGPEGSRIVTRPTAELERLDSLLQKHALALADVEIVAHRILLNYAWHMRARWAPQHRRQLLEHLTWRNDLAKREERRTGGASSFRQPLPDDLPPSDDAATERALARPFALLAADGAPAAITSLYPPGDQYPRLMHALVRYKQLDAQGGFPTLPDSLKSLKPGAHHPDLHLLHKRLALEGWIPPDSPAADTLDDNLQRGLRAFQRAQQLKDSGKPDKNTLAALNITTRQRLHTLRLALQRWRQAPPRQGDWVYINIPDFHGELWRQDTRQHRFRTVVGNTGAKNHTPIQRAIIDRVIYNPFWNIPARILKEEVLPRDVADLSSYDREAWLASRGYELMSPGTSWEWVRQRPGPGNALGQVKIIFPNPHDTYLHDTQSKKLFKEPVRAFSHGCMRVQNPLDLARLLLENDGSFDERSVQRILASREETALFLKKPVPIFIDYITVRIEDDGQPHFLHDIYRHDPPPPLAATPPHR